MRLFIDGFDYPLYVEYEYFKETPEIVIDSVTLSCDGPDILSLLKTELIDKIETACWENEDGEVDDERYKEP